MSNTAALRACVEVRGKANVNPCSLCGGTAYEWSYDRRVHPAKAKENGYRWSTADYVAFCRADRKLVEYAFRRGGRAGLLAEYPAIQMRARARLTSDQRREMADQRQRQFEINERIYAEQDARRDARHAKRQARIRAEIAQREAVKAPSPDPVAGFLDSFQHSAGENLLAIDTHSAYLAWAEGNEIPRTSRLGRNALYSAISARGVKRVKTSRGVSFSGVRITRKEYE